MDLEGPEIVVDLSGGQRLALYPFMDTARFWLRVEVEHPAATTPSPLVTLTAGVRSYGARQ